MTGPRRLRAPDRSRPGVRGHRGGRWLLALALFPLHPLLSTPSCAQPAPAEAVAGGETGGAGETAAHPDDSLYPDEIVVTARRGEALVAAEKELGEQEIGSYGAGTIGELVARVAPLTGRAGEVPIILIDGERVDSTGGIFGFPPEALERLAILPPEAAGRYGYPGQRRVVNLVVKKHFVSWQADGGATVPTAGGKHALRLSAGRFMIDGKSRWNVKAQLSEESALLKSERPGGADGGAVDPGAPDPDAYRTLLPSSRAISLNAGLTRPLGSFSGSFNLTAGRNDSRQLLGLGVLSGRSHALRGDRGSTNLGLSTAISGRIAGWHSSIIARYSRAWFSGSLERAALPADPQAGIATDRTRGHGENLAVQFSASKPVLPLPAGMLTPNISVNLGRNRTYNERFDGRLGTRSETELQRADADARLSFAVPLLRRQGPLAALGDLSLDLAANIAAASGTPLTSRFDAALNWTPFAALQIRASAGFAQLFPSDDQLNGPYFEEVRRIYDFARQEIADAVWITGGNPDLGRGKLRSYSLRAAVRPFADGPLTLTSEYQRQTATGGVGAFPGLTPAIESVFPERFVRDAAGRLVSVDARPIAIARDIGERLDNSLTLSLTSGSGQGADAATAPPPDPWQITLSINHSWLLRSELLTRVGASPIDRLRGDTAQSRHSAGFQLVAGKPGMGMTLDGNWQSGFRLRAPGDANGAGDYRHRPVTIVNLRLFAEPARLLRKAEKPAWLSNLTVSLDIQNLFDTYRRVLLADGSIPAGYARYEVDPLGRAIQLSVRKRF
jgi:hypothetical protein